jgi:hypothetical protein
MRLFPIWACHSVKTCVVSCFSERVGMELIAFTIQVLTCPTVRPDNGESVQHQEPLW